MTLFLNPDTCLFESLSQALLERSIVKPNWCLNALYSGECGTEVKPVNWGTLFPWRYSSMYRLMYNAGGPEDKGLGAPMWQSGTHRRLDCRRKEKGSKSLKWMAYFSNSWWLGSVSLDGHRQGYLLLWTGGSDSLWTTPITPKSVTACTALLRLLRGCRTGQNLIQWPLLSS